MEKVQEYHQVTMDEWRQWKEDIRDKLRETAGNFVYIGYRLRQIRDSGMYGGEADVFEFAQKEYGLGKSAVSRFIAINEKFSEGGYSLELKAEFRDMGSSKLSEMLTLPDAECSLITERTTVKEIRELKDFLRQQAPTSEMEREEQIQGQMEVGDFPELAPEACQEGGAREEAAGEPCPLQKCLKEYFRDQKEKLNDVVAMVHGNEYKAAAERMAPSGYGTCRKGTVFVFMYEYGKGVKYKVFGEPEVREMTWQEFLERIYDMYGSLYEAGEEDVHGAYYGVRKEPESGHEKASDAGCENSGKSGRDAGLEPSVATSQQGREADHAKAATEGGQAEPEGGHDGRLRRETSGGCAGAGDGDAPTDGKVRGPDEGGGVPGGGCEADPWERIKSQSHEEIWEEIAAAQKGLEKFVWGWNAMDPSSFPREHLEEAYRNAVDLAAALEKLMIVRDCDGEVDNAQ